MEKKVYLIVKNLYDGDGELFEVSPIVACSSKSIAERLFSSYKQAEQETNEFFPESVLYELKQVELYE